MSNINIETSADSELLQESKGREGVGETRCRKTSLGKILAEFLKINAQF